MAQILKYNLGGQSKQPNVPSITINGKSYALDDNFKQGVYKYIDTFDEDLQYYMKSLFNLYTNGTSIDTHTNTIEGVDLNRLDIPNRKKHKLGKHQSSVSAFFNSEDMNNWKRATIHLANYNPDQTELVEPELVEPERKNQFSLASIKLGDSLSIRNVDDLNNLKNNLSNISQFEVPTNLSYINSDTIAKYTEILDKVISGSNLTDDEKNNLKDLNVTFVSSVTPIEKSSSDTPIDGDSIGVKSPHWDGDMWVNGDGKRLNMSYDANKTSLILDETAYLSDILKTVTPWNTLSNGDKIYKTKDNTRIIWFHDGKYYYKIIPKKKNGGKITKFKPGGKTAIGQFFEDRDINLKPMLPHALGVVDHVLATFGNNKIEDIEKAIARTTLSGMPVKPSIVYPIFSANDYIAGQHAINKFRNTNLNLSSDARLNLGHIAANASKVYDAEVSLNNNLSNAYTNYKNSWLQTKQKDNELSAQNETAARQIAVNAAAQMLQAKGKRIHSNTASSQELVRKWITDLEKDAAKMDQLKQKMYMSNASELIASKMTKEATQKYPDQTDAMTHWKTTNPQEFLKRQMEILDELNYTDMPQTSLFSTWWT